MEEAVNDLRNTDGRCYICSSIWYCTCNNESNIGEDEQSK